MTTQPAVALQGVHKAFGPHSVLRGVSFSVGSGETLVVIGRSGSGKSVTIKHIVGLVNPDSGDVLVFGQNLATVKKRDRAQMRLQMGYLFQSSALLNWMTIEENVELPLLEHRRNMSRQERKDRVHKNLGLVELENAGGKFPSEISGGMKKRAALARAMMLDPKILLYDEPTSGLDPVMSRTIDELIINTGTVLQATQIIVTHDMSSAYRVADKIAMLYEGRIIAQGTPEEIQQTDDPIVQQFITGSSKGPITHTG
jgi:phospholipid/cholesterol/gamma-HCH transport system ATP-binding protein